MPDIVITQAFNHREGSQVTHYPKSEAAVVVSQAVADHALTHGFTPKPEVKPQKATAKHAATAAAATTEPGAGK